MRHLLTKVNYKYICFLIILVISLALGLSSIQTSRVWATSDATPFHSGKTSTLWLHWDSSILTHEALKKEVTNHKVNRRVIVLNAWEYHYIPTLKAANPSVMVMVYKDLSSTRDYACHDGTDEALLPTGVGYCESLKHHPEWFLTDRKGKRLLYDGYPGHWQMDVGNASYQQAWLNNVKQELITHNWDGVWMDNALNACDQYHAGVCPAIYPSDTAMQAAYKNMLSVTYPSLKAAGKKSIANMANARLYPGLWSAYLTYLDGGFDEWWLTFGSGQYLPEYGNPSEGWKAQVNEIAAAEANGKMAIVQAHTDLTDVRGFYYSLASYFLVNNGRSVYAEIGKTDDYGQPTPWRVAYNWNLGVPSGVMKAIAHNVYQRHFTCGLVAVNANGSGSYKLKLHKPYLNASGTPITSVTLGSTSGVILRSPDCRL